jgi:hypothetical protein
MSRDGKPLLALGAEHQISFEPNGRSRVPGKCTFAPMVDLSELEVL